MGLPSMRPLLLAGGKSTRMGTPKHLLRMPDGTPLYRRQLELLRSIFPEPQTIYISLAQESETDEYLESLLSADAELTPEDEDSPKAPRVKILRDEHPNDSRYSAGPAAGLLAAYRFDRWANWVVVACDYPLLPPDAIYLLMYKRDAVPVTCYRSAEGFCEPLVAIWAPAALSRLSERVARGHSSPAATVKELDGLMVDTPPGCEWWLTNVNTMEEWVKAIEDMKLGSLEPLTFEAPKGKV
ncbi:molybdenum cofactor biosynthesis protein C [Colletotrichum truncatum]|uniref:Molybdenum cofactor biosynthesis protein C n=1 Tax=Colletotrichum truncatum TaxID=5467 RepID=A0ACC3YSE5_COLTU|nr:molybdenum cofactor biosynthesis protein C [Colletotrichum truncatum]KAF6789818.1 molybdenum cofactor biosynthesis protein C [Colletotrichum truncatum]